MGCCAPPSPPSQQTWWLPGCPLDSELIVCPLPNRLASLGLRSRCCSWWGVPRESKGSTHQLCPCFQFSLALDNFHCHAPLAFGQCQRPSLSDYFVSLKGSKASSTLLSQMFGLRYLLRWALCRVKQDEKSSATARCCLSWNSPAGLFPTVAEHTGAV